MKLTIMIVFKLIYWGPPKNFKIFIDGVKYLQEDGSDSRERKREGVSFACDPSWNRGEEGMLKTKGWVVKIQ